MNKLPIVKIISFLVMVGGTMVAIGWFFDIGFLKSILPNATTMKFTVALCFIASGMILYSIAKERGGDSFILQTIAPALVLLILLLMVTSLLSLVFSINTGIDNLFIIEKAGAVKTIASGTPSAAAMVNFILIAISSLFVLADSPKQNMYLILFGGLNVITGTIAIIGYSIGVPILYYYIPNINTALAIPAAILFILTGIGFFLCGKTASN
jgi:hypothetical protein